MWFSGLEGSDWAYRGSCRPLAMDGYWSVVYSMDVSSSRSLGQDRKKTPIIDIVRGGDEDDLYG